VLWAAEVEQQSLSERRFHLLLAEAASQPLTELLLAIDAYERFCRLLQDAFDDCLFYLSQHQQRLQPHELAVLVSVQQAADQIPKVFAHVSEKLLPFGETVRFQDTFSSLAEAMPPADWAQRLLDHHCRIQLVKPPAGRAPRVDRFDDGSCMIRTAYIRDTGGRNDDAYVHAYRTMSLWSFAKDLGLVK
jgi:hypothetical protein